MRNKKASNMSLFGTSRAKSLLLIIIPLITLGVAGINNSFDLNSHLYGFIAAFGTFIYCIFEEYGWRGYLQDELRNFKSWQKYLLIGSSWYLWHLSFLSVTSLSDNLIFLGMLVFASWGIGQIAIATRSIIACACFHFIVNILAFNQLIKNGFEENAKWIAVGVIILISVIIISRWPKTQKNVIPAIPNS